LDFEHNSGSLRANSVAVSSGATLVSGQAANESAVGSAKVADRFGANRQGSANPEFIACGRVGGGAVHFGFHDRSSSIAQFL
jgi:hypothetical protein